MTAAPVCIELSSPVHFGSEIVAKLELQPITGAAMRHVPLPAQRNVPPHYYLELASAVSGYPPPLFDLLSAQDVLAVVQAVATMVDPSVGTTGRVSPRSR
jgi:hypothetical protein